MLPPDYESEFLMTDTSHKAASHNLREIASWLPGKGSADSDLLPELDTIVARSRDLSRNHGIAAGAMQTLSDNIVGTGFRLSAKPDYRLLHLAGDEFYTFTTSAVSVNLVESLSSVP